MIIDNDDDLHSISSTVLWRSNNVARECNYGIGIMF